METQTWDAKTPTEVRGYLWKPEFEQGDSLASVSVAVSSGTVTATAEIEGNGVRVVVTGGAAAENARLLVTAVTREPRTYTLTAHVPVRDTAPLYTQTARDVVEFAMRKITGSGGVPDSSEMTDGIEMLNDMLSVWRIAGLDVGIAKQVAENDTLSLPETYLAAIKYNLAVWMAEEFDRPLTAGLVMRANETKRLLENELLSLRSLRFDRALLRRLPITSWTDLE